MMTKEKIPMFKDRQNNDGQRFMRGCSIRALKAEGEESSRRFELSFSSEEPYERWWDAAEVLSHAEGAVNLERLQSIGVVLYNHKRDCVIGKVTKAWVDNKRGMAEVEFDKDQLSEEIYQKVLSGTLKATSVAYQVHSYEEIKAGKTSADGIEGPCAIARSWTPMEISIVSVPADASVGVGRSHESGERQAPDLSIYEQQLVCNKNYLSEV